MERLWEKKYSVFVLILMSISLMLSACSKSEEFASDNSNPVVSWIQQNAIPLRTVVPGGSDTDLGPLDNIVGDATIVGLGEETHGTHEIIDMKARLAEYLITHLGFTTFIMENNWGASEIVNDYIQGGSENIQAVVKHGLFGSWQTQEYQNMLEWMRSYNADAKHTQKITFLGMDCQSASQNEFDAVESYVASLHNPFLYDEVKGLYAGVMAYTTQQNASQYASLPVNVQWMYTRQAQQVYDLLKSQQQYDAKNSSAGAFALALQNARVITQVTIYLGKTVSGQRNTRDSFMAENVAWIKSHASETTTPKIIVWAHDAHIANGIYSGSSTPTASTGSFLRQWYPSSYLAIGTSLYQGSYMAYLDGYQKIEEMKLDASDKSSYNFMLGSVNTPLYMLDMRKTPAGSVTSWATGPTSFQLIGIDGQSMAQTISLQHWFDVIVSIHDSMPSDSLYVQYNEPGGIES